MLRRLPPRVTASGRPDRTVSGELRAEPSEPLHPWSWLWWHPWHSPRGPVVLPGHSKRRPLLINRRHPLAPVAYLVLLLLSPLILGLIVVLLLITKGRSLLWTASVRGWFQRR
jgi:hypothetical protein